MRSLPVWMLALALPLAACAQAADDEESCLGNACQDAAHVDAADTGTGKDTGVAKDSASPDTGAIDTSVIDTGAADTSVVDSGGLDGAKPDTGSADTSTPDTGSTDTGSPDTGSTDTGSTDAGCTLPAVGGTCSLVPQCGCGAGQKCEVPLTNGVTACMAAGTVAANKPCTAMTDCAAGLTCFAGLCQPLCNTTADCPTTTPASICGPVQYVPTGSTTAVDIPGMNVCEMQCNPKSPGKCGSGNGCWFVTPTTTSCRSAGTGTTYGDCASDPLACAPGYVCVSPGDCLKACTSSADCALFDTCYWLSSHPTLGTKEYGVCDF
jgi:hypothetical protein